jgi:hypothetical protein
MSPLLEHRPSLWITHKENGPLFTTGAQCGLMRANVCNAAGINGLMCLLKHGFQVHGSKFTRTIEIFRQARSNVLEISEHVLDI